MRLVPLLLLSLQPFSLAAEPVFRLGEDVVPLAQSVHLRLDPQSDSFIGSVSIDIQARRAVSSFRLHAEDLSIGSVRLDGEEAAHQTGEHQTLIIQPRAPMAVGRHKLEIDYTANFNRQTVGLYKVMKGSESFLFTQFQAIDARKAMPCWDEPAFKIPWTITLEVPLEYEALSNTPLESQQRGEVMRTVRFARSHPMPSYLVALAVGRFDFSPVSGTSIPTRLVVPRGQTALTGLAADLTPPLLRAMEKYFGTKYPYEKLDLIAVPDFWAGAMENPGAITFRDSILLVDPKQVTPQHRRRLASLIAHELAHMWFGDWVTMQWWDDFWLNESFADWIGDKITDQLFPELGLKAAEMLNIQQAMEGDAQLSAIPMRNPAADPQSAMQSVGVLYNKGKAVLSMFESWMGEEKFRRGVLDHLKSNAWANADSEEFFTALGKMAPLGTVAALRSFVDQPGIPLLHFVHLPGSSTVKVRQSRLLYAGQAAPMLWRVPVAIRYADGGSMKVHRVLIDRADQVIDLPGENVQWIFPDAAAAGYYRWSLPPGAVQSLAARATGVLTVPERMAFLGNLSALLKGGSLRGDAYLKAVRSLAADPDPRVVTAAAQTFDDIRRAFQTAQTAESMATYVRSALRPALDRWGITPRAGEEETVTMLRPLLLQWLGEVGEDPEVLTFARQQAEAHLQGSASLHASLLETVIRLHALEGDQALFEEYRKRFETARTPAERSRYLQALGSFRHPDLHRRALEYALSGPLRANEMLATWNDETAEHRTRGFEFLTSRFDAFAARLPQWFVARLPRLAAGCEANLLDQAKRFFAQEKHRVEGTEKEMRQVSEAVESCLALRERELPRVAEYLASQP